MHRSLRFVLTAFTLPQLDVFGFNLQRKTDENVISGISGRNFFLIAGWKGRASICRSWITIWFTVHFATASSSLVWQQNVSLGLVQGCQEEFWQKKSLYLIFFSHKGVKSSEKRSQRYKKKNVSNVFRNPNNNPARGARNKRRIFA